MDVNWLKTRIFAEGLRARARWISSRSASILVLDYGDVPPNTHTPPLQTLLVRRRRRRSIRHGRQEKKERGGALTWNCEVSKRERMLLFLKLPRTAEGLSGVAGAAAPVKSTVSGLAHSGHATLCWEAAAM